MWLSRLKRLVDALILEQEAGKIRYLGCSSWSATRVQSAQKYAASIGHQGFVACQPRWSLADSDHDAMLQQSPSGYYEDGYRVLHADLPMIPYSG